MKSGILYESERTLTQAGLAKGSRLAQKGTVLVLVRGSELHKRIPIGIAAKSVAFNQDVKALTAKGELSNRYLFYWLLANEPLLLSKVEHTGIGAGKLDTGVLQNLEVALPPLSEQTEITEIVGTVDDKIELNRRMSETLEELVREAHNAWFTDGENLDPTSTVVDEPHSTWRTGRVKDVANEQRRIVNPESVPVETPYIGLEHMPRRRTNLDSWGSAGGLGSNKYEFNRGEILFGKLRPYFHKVGVAPLEGICSTDIVVVAPKDPAYFGYLLGLLSSDEFVAFTDASSTGTRMPRTSWKTMSSFEIRLPPPRVAQAFDDFARPIVERTIAATFENQTLAALRDTLLPKLISGELRVPEAEQLVSEVA